MLPIVCQLAAMRIGNGFSLFKNVTVSILHTQQTMSYDVDIKYTLLGWFNGSYIPLVNLLFNLPPIFHFINTHLYRCLISVSITQAIMSINGCQYLIIKILPITYDEFLFNLKPIILYYFQKYTIKLIKYVNTIMMCLLYYYITILKSHQSYIYSNVINIGIYMNHIVTTIYLGNKYNYLDVHTYLFNLLFYYSLYLILYNINKLYFWNSVYKQCQYLCPDAFSFAQYSSFKLVSVVNLLFLFIFNKNFVNKRSNCKYVFQRKPSFPTKSFISFKPINAQLLFNYCLTVNNE